jgi:outer membrane murein-binding lipoprotein Lpp
MVTRAAQELKAQRFMLDEDVEATIAAAQAAQVP